MTAKAPRNRAGQRQQPHQLTIQDVAALPKPIIIGGLVALGLGLVLVARAGGTAHLSRNGLTLVMGAS